jgi:DNA-binding NarL/FixJ family response regulator
MRRTQSIQRAALVAVERSGTPSTVDELWRRLVCDGWQVVLCFDADGHRYFVAADTDRSRLSARERGVVTHASRGSSNKAIAIDLGVALGSVSSSLSSALRKMGVGSRANLVALAALVSDPEAA